MNQFVGLVVFSIGLGLFVFPQGVAAGVGERIGRTAGHWETVAVRAVGVLGMAAGFAALVV